MVSTLLKGRKYETFHISGREWRKIEKSRYSAENEVDPDGSEDTDLFAGYSAFLVGKNLQLDAFVGRAVSDPAADAFVGVGLSSRLPRNR